MRLWREIANRVAYLGRRSRFDREMDDEIRFHLEARADELEREGLTRRDAEAQARREFGPRARSHEDTRAAWQVRWIEELFADLRYAVRTFARSPAFAVTVIACLALGIGANTAIFGVFNAAVLKALPVRDPGALVMLTDPSFSGRRAGIVTSRARDSLTYAEFEELRDRSQTMEGMFASEANLPRLQVSIAGGGLEEVRGRLVSEEYFAALGVEPLLGRFFTVQDARGIGSDPYIVISHDYWQRRFGANFGAVGARVHLNKTILTIIGVAPPAFHGETVGQFPDLWLPMMMQPQAKPGRDWIHEDLSQSIDKVMWLHVFGRLKPGVTVAAAQAEMNVLFRRIIETGYPLTLSAETRKDVLDQRVRVRDASAGAFPGRERFAQQVQMLMVVAGLVLIIACANIANLLLARAVGRRREVSVRLSLGAARGRLLRQFLTETLLLAACGGVFGGLLAAGGARLLLRVMAGEDSTLDLALDFDWRMLAFTLGATLLTSVLFGIAPAVRATAANPVEGLRKRFVLAQGLVAAQVALSLLVMVGAGLFARTLWNLQSADLGFVKEGLMVVRIDPLATGHTGPRLTAMYQELAERLRSVPGVRSATYSQNGLLSGSNSGGDVEVEGEVHSSSFDRIADGYFAALGVPMVSGREFDGRDMAGAAPVCVVNETFVRSYFKERNPIGRRFTYVDGDFRLPLEVVGVARDMRSRRVFGPAEPRFYVPRHPVSAFSPNMFLEVRTAGNPERLAGTIRAAIAEVNRDLPVQSTRSVEELVYIQNAQPRMIARLSSAFGAAAVVLAAIGLYGVLAYGVSRRTREMGIRMALGATRGRVARMILGEAGVVVAVGVVVGTAGAVAAARLVSAWLYGVDARDPVTYGAAAVGLSVVALVASYWPARRAAGTNPITALRLE